MLAGAFFLSLQVAHGQPIRRLDFNPGDPLPSGLRSISFSQERFIAVGVYGL